MTMLPIFELPLVLLPTELVPLHIFEERYKRMANRSIDDGEPFGVVLRDEESGARSTGCSAEVESVLERFEDGRLNIVARGVVPVRVLERFDAPEWPAAEVEELEDVDVPSADPELAVRARGLFAELAVAATGEEPSERELAGAGAYELAGRIDLPAATKQMLLESRDEDERLAMLVNALTAVRAAIDRGELIADRARSNGRVAIDGRRR